MGRRSLTLCTGHSLTIAASIAWQMKLSLSFGNRVITVLSSMLIYCDEKGGRSRGTEKSDAMNEDNDVH